MSTYCDYCFSRDHASWCCPKLAKADQLAEREMVQAQTPVVNVQEEAPND